MAYRLSTVILVFAVFFQKSGHGGVPLTVHNPWKYADDHNGACSTPTTSCGPSDWKSVAGFESCGASDGQSPIDLIKSKAVLHPQYTVEDLELKCDVDDHCTEADYIINSYTIQVDLSKTCNKRCHAVWNGKTYYLKEFHYHSPSEHTMDEGYFPMEAQHVHMADDGQVLVLAVLVTVGGKPPGNFTYYSAGAWLRDIFKKMLPVDNVHNYYSNRSSKPVLGVDPYFNFVPQMASSFYYYNGSSTTPPCHSNTVWIIAPTPIRIRLSTLDIYRNILNSIPKSQLATFDKITGSNRMPQWNAFVPTQNLAEFRWNTAIGCNNRPIQPIASRTLYKIGPKADQGKNLPAAAVKDAKFEPCRPPTTTTTTTTTSTTSTTTATTMTTTTTRATCLNYPCPQGATRRENPQDRLCHLPYKCNALDAQECCSGTVQCSSFQCPAEARNHPERVCTNDKCDYNTCCERRATCINFACPDGTDLIPEPKTQVCKYETHCCNEDIPTCCRKPCTHFKCPSGLILRPSPRRIHCAKNVCTVDDSNTCCMPVTTPPPNPCSSSSAFWGRPDVIGGTVAASALGVAGIAAAGIGIAVAHSKDKSTTSTTMARTTTTITTAIRIRIDVIPDQAADSLHSSDSSDSLMSSSATASLGSLSGTSWAGIVALLAGVLCLVCCGLCLAYVLCGKSKKRQRGARIEADSHHHLVHHKSRSSRDLVVNEEEGHLVAGDPDWHSNGSHYVPHYSMPLLPVPVPPAMATIDRTIYDYTVPEKDAFADVHFGALGDMAPSPPGTRSLAVHTASMVPVVEAGMIPSMGTGGFRAQEVSEPAPVGTGGFVQDGLHIGVPTYGSVPGPPPQDFYTQDMYTQAIDPAMYTAGFQDIQPYQLQAPPWTQHQWS